MFSTVNRLYALIRGRKRALGLKSFLMGDKRANRANAIKYFNGKLRNEVLDKQILFIHVPKAAGTSIVQSLYNRHDWCHLNYRDYQQLFDNQNFDSISKIAFVRDPYDRFVSAYNYLRYKSRASFDRFWVESNIGKDSIDSFIERWLDAKSVEDCSVDHFRSQASYLCDSAGELNIDYIGKLETLGDDISRINAKFGLKITVKHENMSPGGTETALSPKSIDRISQAYDRDFSLFGYQKL